MASKSKSCLVGQELRAAAHLGSLRGSRSAGGSSRVTLGASSFPGPRPGLEQLGSLASSCTWAALPRGLPPRPLLDHWVSSMGDRAPQTPSLAPKSPGATARLPLVRRWPLLRPQSRWDETLLLWSPLCKEAHRSRGGLAFNKQRLLLKMYLVI